MLAAALVAAVAATAVPAPGPAAAHEASEQRIRETRSKLSQVREELESLDERRQDAAAHLAAAEQQVAEVLAEVRAAEEEVARHRAAVDRAEQRLEELRARAVEQRQAMRNRAAELFKQASATPMSVSSVLAATTPEEALRRSSLAQAATRGDRRKAEELALTQDAIASQQLTLEAEQESLERVAEERRALLAEVEELRDSRAAEHARIASQFEDLRQHESHLSAEQQRLAALARRSARQRAGARSAGAGAPAVSAQGWAWPARGQVTSEYGPRWGRMHEGIDIANGTGAPVSAARGGTVSHAGRMGGYGNLVLVDHGGGVATAYAHLSRITVRPGQQVGVGDGLGAMGCTGSCTGPHLHFEVRVNGSPRNPRNYLP